MSNLEVDGLQKLKTLSGNTPISEGQESEATVGRSDKAMFCFLMCRKAEMLFCLPQLRKELLIEFLWLSCQLKTVWLFSSEVSHQGNRAAYVFF